MTPKISTSSYTKLHHVAKAPNIVVTVTIDCDVITSSSLSLIPQAGLWLNLPTETDPLLKEKIIFWLQNYSKGENLSYSLPIQEPYYPPYYGKVIEYLKTIPWGTVISYQELASKAGSTKAARAVGSACRYNHFPLIIPCHRVLAANKKIGGFTPGMEIKRRLLNHEKIFFIG